MRAYDLQLFAERTLPATPNKRAEARKEGQVSKSSDLTNAISFVTAAVVLRLAGPAVFWGLYNVMVESFTAGVQFASVAPGAEPAQLQQIAGVGSDLIPLAAAVIAAGVFVSFIQVRGLFVVKRLLPDLKKINPITGFQHLFSLRSLVELVKAVLKISILLGAVWVAVSGLGAQVPALLTATPEGVFAAFATDAFDVLIVVAGAFLVLSIGDFYFQRYDFERNLRMSREEVKEESRRMEGSPEIRRKLRERAVAIARRRMLRRVPTADVVVTNPTHYAIALAYDAAQMHAPQVVAKGADLLAQRIRDIAREHDVPIVENPPLARALYQQVELEEYVPAALFQAVAQVLAYVYRLKRRQIGGFRR